MKYLSNRLLRWFFYFFLIAISSFFSFLILYVFIAFVFSIFPVNTHYKKPANGIPIYVVASDIHADIIVPVNYPRIKESNWLKYFKQKNEKSIINNKNIEFIGFGWGDRNFYLETPTWDDLKIKNVAYALFWNSPSVMHISYYRSISINYPGLKKLLLTEKQYQLLLKHLRDSFKQNANGELIKIPDVSYWEQDEFYEARGPYNLFNTCNSWAGRALRKTGIKMGVWTPLHYNILYHLD